MDIILLTVSEWNLRQLYHELLFSKTVEVVPTASISNALLLLTLSHFAAAVFYIDEQNAVEMEVFLSLRKKHQGLRNTKIILLTADNDAYASLLTDRDRILDPLKSTPQELINNIKSSIKGV